MEIKVKQRIIEGRASYERLSEVIDGLGAKKLLLVYTEPVKFLPVWDYIKNFEAKVVPFCDFTSNPKYEEVVAGVELFKAEECDAIVAIGGGSAIDVAKCIKLYCKMPKGEIYLKQEYSDTGIPLIAMPTTAGTGSESTPYAVIYYGGVKQSVHHESILPSVAVLDSDVLTGLPVYQKKCTVLDALCQAIESYWSVHSTDECKAYAKAAIEKIRDNIFEYVEENTESSRAEIMSAANLAGRAICITATTAPHAMSYKITSKYGFPHGHAVAIGLHRVWKYMLENGDKCTDKRGFDYLLTTFGEIAKALGYDSAEEAIDGFKVMLNRLEICDPDEIGDLDAAAETLAASVNVERLGNNPVALDKEALLKIYLEILRK